MVYLIDQNTGTRLYLMQFIKFGTIRTKHNKYKTTDLLHWNKYYSIQGFKLSRSAKVVNFLTPALNNLVASLTAPNPVLIEEKCIGCRKCDEVCPERSKVISFVKHNGKTIPKWKYNYCIQCFCCQELCPRGAIVIKDKSLKKMIGLK